MTCRVCRTQQERCVTGLPFEAAGGAEPANRMILFEAELVFADCSNSIRGLFGIDQSPPDPGSRGALHGW